MVELWQEKEIQSANHDNYKYQSGWKKHPELYMSVKEAAGVYALDQIGTANCHLQDFTRLHVNLYLPAIFASDFNYSLMS